MRIGLACCTLALGGCFGPNIRYTNVPPDTTAPDSANALRFTLQDASITLAKSALAPSGKSDPSSAPTLATKDACAGTKAIGGFSRCLAGIGVPRVVSVAVDENGTYLAQPRDFLPSLFFETKLSGTPVVNSNYLYQKIQVPYTDNLTRTISSVGGGAATGFSIGGPPGAAVGAVLGGIVAANNRVESTTRNNPFAEPAVWAWRVCASVRQSLDLTKFNQEVKPALGLPVSIRASQAGPFGSSTEEDKLPPKSPTDTDNPGCWRPLPNTLLLNDPPPIVFTDKPPPDPKMAMIAPTRGDGWFYRIIVVNPGPPANQKTSGYLPVAGKPGTIKSNQFPFSYCRKKALLEVTWWRELSGLQRNGLRVVRFEIPSFPDPDYVSVVNVPRGGTITFNSTCGAVASRGSGPDLSADWNALNTQVNGILKAETSANPAMASKAKAIAK